MYDHSDNSLKSIIRQLILFSLPLILSGVLQQLYSWADAFIVGNVEGELGLGAIGATGMIVNFYTITINGFTVGLSVLFGQSYGAGRTETIRKAMSTFAIFVTGISLALVAIGTSIMSPVMTLLHTPEGTVAPAKRYLAIVGIGIPFLAIYNVYYAALRGIGNSRVPFFAVLISSCANVLLDILFVAILRWGVSGAACATVLSQAAMAVFVVVYTSLHEPLLRFNLRRGAFDRGVLREGLRFGIPMMIQSNVACVANFFIQDFMNSFGQATLVAVTTAYRIESLMMVPVVNMGAALCTLCAQCFGAQDRERLRKVYKSGFWFILGVTMVMTFAIVPFSRQLTAAFGAGDEAAEIARQHFFRISGFYVIFAIVTSMRSYLQGIGDVKFAGMVSVIDLTSRVVVTHFLIGIIGRYMIAYGEGIAWTIGMVFFIIRMRMMRPRLEQMADKTATTQSFHEVKI